MEDQTPTTRAEWDSIKVSILGAICLVLGIAAGALFHGPARPSIPLGIVAQQVPAMPPQGAPNMPGAVPPAAAVADPVFEKVQSDPNNFDLLAAAGNAEMRKGEAKRALDYYGRALKVKDDLDVRISLANADFRAGSPDQSLVELAKVLHADPKNDKALYNVGVVRLAAKGDAKGAIASWETLLKYHPDHPHKAEVLEMIKQARKFGVKATREP
jgi:cytochrome c-type biogenesis protein CcmH/NrfG